jgi:hypothetical protein
MKKKRYPKQENAQLLQILLNAYQNNLYEATRTSLDSIYELVCDSARAYKIRHGKNKKVLW